MIDNGLFLYNLLHTDRHWGNTSTKQWDENLEFQQVSDILRIIALVNKEQWYGFKTSKFVKLRQWTCRKGFVPNDLSFWKMK